ncbi:uncharacterized protein FOMMEDRAFT_136188 [Fomitiporia mediterranea MF3/22]|uniref:uncharacterized protein n=1 Tax=Fomitiporia mediterranea (strain MF3/22) TaxID=694068 RepID=UPI00044079C4|nr:uncharacterized protein FOMMEDRAFT_136188 [Fomitiporia mediterranea MF3/22]EJD00055.1 hypothetical protein FOMMEDRAFT_136188 [Fomitiporia mediterranea MF3/22]
MKRDPFEGAGEPIPMDERQEVVKALLDVSYPNRSLTITDITSFDFLRDLAFVFVEKYDVPAGVTAIRSFIFDTRFSISPILIFGLARSFSWNEEAEFASTLTLDLDFRLPDVQSQLQSIGPQNALDLIQLRASRRRIVLDAMLVDGDKRHSEYTDTQIDWLSICTVDSGDGTETPTGNQCNKWSSFANDPVWMAFKFLISEELEIRPSGKGLKEHRFWSRPVVDDVRKLGQTCPSCLGSIFTPDALHDAINDLIDRIPKSVK